VQHRAEEGRQAAAALMVFRPFREEAGLIGRIRLNTNAEGVWIARPRLERLLPRMAAAIDPVAKRDRSLCRRHLGCRDRRVTVWGNLLTTICLKTQRSSRPRPGRGYRGRCSPGVHGFSTMLWYPMGRAILIPAMKRHSAPVGGRLRPARAVEKRRPARCGEATVVLVSTVDVFSWRSR